MQPSRTVAALLSGLLSVSLQAQDIAASATVLSLDSARLQAMGVELVGVQVTPDYALTRVPARLQIADTARQSVVAPFAGAILRVAVLEGQVVQPGDVLAEVRSPDWQARLAEAAQREAAWADAKARAERSEALLDAGVISAREAEQARAAWRAATTTRNTMQADRMVLGQFLPATPCWPRRPGWAVEHRLHEVLEVARLLEDRDLLAQPRGAWLLVAERPAGDGLD